MKASQLILLLSVLSVLAFSQPNRNPHLKGTVTEINNFEQTITVTTDEDGQVIQVPFVYIIAHQERLKEGCKVFVDILEDDGVMKIGTNLYIL